MLNVTVWVATKSSTTRCSVVVTDAASGRGGVVGVEVVVVDAGTLLAESADVTGRSASVHAAARMTRAIREAIRDTTRSANHTRRHPRRQAHARSRRGRCATLRSMS